MLDTFWASGWFPFATTESQYLAIDMSPGKSGQTGQVIVCGFQGTEGESLSDSLAEFFGQIESGLNSEFFYFDKTWEAVQGYGWQW